MYKLYTENEETLMKAMKNEAIKEEVEKLISEKVLYEETHQHSKDQYDSDNNAEAVCKRTKELGRKTVFLTQHGIAAATWSFKNAAKKYGLKFVPGIETYYQKDAKKDEEGIMTYDTILGLEHLILHAEDDLGWKALCMAITDSQDATGYSVMNEEILRKYFGEGSIGHKHVIASSACVDGPLAKVYRRNDKIKKEISKIEKRKDKAIGTDINVDRLEDLRSDISELKDELLELQNEEKSTKSIANTKFTVREKALIKLLEKGDNNAYEVAKKELEDDKTKANEAKNQLDDIKDDITKQKKRIKALEKELKELETLQEKSDNYANQIDDLQDAFISEEDMDRIAEERMMKFEEIFGEGYFFAEIQYHGLEIERQTYPNIVRIARKRNVPIVATNDTHIVDNSEDELLRRQMLNSLRFETWNELRDADKELYIKSDDEMKKALYELYPEDVVKEGMVNSLAIAVRCNVKFDSQIHHPKYIPSKNDTRSAYEIFMDHINKGIKEHFPNGLDKEHIDRLNHEVDIIKNMGYIDYHLVVEDFLDYAKEYEAIPVDKIKDAPLNREELITWKEKQGFTERVGIATGAGRGSAGGSLVCNLLNITKLDPLNYNLLFERFLNPERVSMPDIDSDISRNIRPIVIDYVKAKYGEDCVAGIVTQNAQAPRGSIRLAAKCLGLCENKDNKKDNGAKKYLSLGDKIAKAVPEEVDITFDTVLEKEVRTVYELMQEQFKDDEKALKILEWAKILEGVFTAYAAHAAGIVITDGTPIKEIVPLRWNKKLGIYTTQCNMNEVEDNGMLKFDFLGLKTLDVINDCLWQLRSEGNKINLYDIPLNDKDVFSEIFSKAKTNSVFQFESNGMKNMLKRFNPESFDDLVILVAMFRPGPLQYIDGVIDVKTGVKPMTFLDPKLEPILGKTYGAIVYQEQVMEIFQKLAGYTLGGADLVRRAMSKKKIEKLRIEKEAFINGDKERNIDGCIKRGVPADVADKLFEQMMDFAKYAFNKSHAAVYAYLAYITGWLKYHYPAQFLMGAMRWAEKQGSKDPIPGLMGEAKSFGVEVKAPNINYSQSNFTIEDNSILFGLGAVKTVGVTADEIIEERNKNGRYKSFKDFFKRSNAKKNAVENLILAGAFDEFGKNRKAMHDAVEDIKVISTKIAKKESFYIVASKMMPYVNELKTKEALIKKQEELGLPIELNGVTNTDKLQKRIDNAKKALDELNDEFNAINILSESIEDLDERMKNERELLGAYVTSHPLDNYPDEVNGINSLDSFDQGTKVVYGLITNVDIRKRRSDGKPMAFLTLEDRFSSIKVNVYTNSYERNAKYLKLGNVVIIDGYAQEDNSFVSDDSDEKSYLLVANNVRLADKLKKAYLLSVNSILTFHAFNEAEFRKKYEEKNGNDFKIYDKTLKEMRSMNYKVSDKVSNIKDVTIIQNN